MLKMKEGKVRRRSKKEGKSEKGGDFGEKVRGRDRYRLTKKE